MHEESKWENLILLCDCYVSKTNWEIEHMHYERKKNPGTCSAKERRRQESCVRRIMGKLTKTVYK